MKYEFIENLTEKQYNELNKLHFMQTYSFGEISKVKGLKPYYVGLKQNNKLIASALLLKKHLIGKYSYFYIPRGFTLDYSNKNLLKVFTDNLKIFTKKHNAIFFTIDPAIKLHDIDQDGNVIGNENIDLVNYLKSIGYKHLGFNKNFENREPRYTFRLKLKPTIEETYSNMHETTKKILKRGNQYNLNIYKGNIDDIDDFYLTMLETSKREKINPFPIKYYEQFYKVFNKENMSDLYIVKVNVEKLKKDYETKIEEINNKINSASKIVNETKKKNLIDDFTAKLNKLKKEYSNIKNITEKELTLSSIITVKYMDKVWTVHGGNHNLLRELNANYILYDTIIKDALKENYKVVDFFGTTGKDSITNPVHGIHLFKRRFGGEYVEFIGEFENINNKLIYHLYHAFLKTKKLLKKIKKN